MRGHRGFKWATASLEEKKARLLSNIVIVNDCWEWQGKRRKKGYGLVSMTIEYGKVKEFLVHRMAYAVYVGDPGKLFVLHKCDNPPCINPEHLFLGTNDDNVADMVSKGRQYRKLSDNDIIKIRSRASDGESQASLAREFSVDRQYIWYIVHNQARI